MPAAPGGPRLLLRRLREAMAEPVSPQARLDRIVTLIAANVIAEVCSVYVLSDDNILELFATEGLNREAVHLTRLRADEGLVGLIAKTAEPLSLSDAQSHPAFSYRPETGEEAYHAFLGVPLLRAGNTLGVLVVQNKTYRVYSEEEIEALQTTAMVLSEMIASGELQALAPGAGSAARRAVSQRGVALADGIGLGHVVLHEPRIVIKQLIAENVDREVERLEQAIGEVRSAIDDLVERGDSIGTGESREVLETVRMFAHDKGWLRRMREAVHSGRVHPLDAAQRRAHPGRLRRAGGHQREQGGVGQRDAAHPVCQPVEVVLPTVPGLEVDVTVAVQLVHDALHDGVEQVLPAGDVPVEGHGLHAQPLPQAAHGQRGQPVGVDEVDRCGDDPFPGEGFAVAEGLHARGLLGGPSATVFGQVGVIGVVGGGDAPADGGAHVAGADG
jgi:putative methionine-R-sulfoxide reductase with GAF domain